MRGIEELRKERARRFIHLQGPHGSGPSMRVSCVRWWLVRELRSSGVWSGRGFPAETTTPNSCQVSLSITLSRACLGNSSRISPQMLEGQEGGKGSCFRSTVVVDPCPVSKDILLNARMIVHLRWHAVERRARTYNMLYAAHETLSISTTVFRVMQ